MYIHIYIHTYLWHCNTHNTPHFAIICVVINEVINSTLLYRVTSRYTTCYIRVMRTDDVIGQTGQTLGLRTFGRPLEVETSQGSGARVLGFRDPRPENARLEQLRSDRCTKSVCEKALLFCEPWP